MKLKEHYKTLTIVEKQKLIDAIREKLPQSRESTIRNWCLGNRNPKSFERKTISRVMKISESELFN